MIETNHDTWISAYWLACHVHRDKKRLRNARWVIRHFDDCHYAFTLASKVFSLQGSTQELKKHCLALLSQALLQVEKDIQAGELPLANAETLEPLRND